MKLLAFNMFTCTGPPYMRIGIDSNVYRPHSRGEYVQYHPPVCLSVWVYWTQIVQQKHHDMWNTVQSLYVSYERMVVVSLTSGRSHLTGGGVTDCLVFLLNASKNHTDYHKNIMAGNIYLRAFLVSTLDIDKRFLLVIGWTV